MGTLNLMKTKTIDRAFKKLRKISKKSLHQKLLKEADRVFSLFIRKRDGACVICGSTERLQNSHLIRRGKHSVRFDELNCHCNCSSHNYMHNHYPEIYTTWFLRKFGKKKYEDLVERSKELKQWKSNELEEIIEKYK